MKNINYRLKIFPNILLTKRTVAQNDFALSYYRVRGLYFLVVIFAATTDIIST